MQTIVLCTITSLLLQTYFILFAALHTYIKLYEAAGERYSYSFLQVFIVAFFSPSQTLCQPIVKNLIIVNFYIALMWCFLSFQMLIWCLDSSVRFADVLYPPN